MGHLGGCFMGLLGRGMLAFGIVKIRISKLKLHFEKIMTGVGWWQLTLVKGSIKLG